MKLDGTHLGTFKSEVDERGKAIGGEEPGPHRERKGPQVGSCWRRDGHGLDGDIIEQLSHVYCTLIALLLMILRWRI